MSFQSYLQGLGYNNQQIGNVRDPNFNENGPGGGAGAPLGNFYNFQRGQRLEDNPNNLMVQGLGDPKHQIGTDGSFGVFTSGDNIFEGYGNNYDQLYSNRPDLAQQYNASLFEGGEGAANAARIRQETDQQRILFEQQQQAARQAARAPENLPQYQGGNIMGLMQYQPQQQQAPQQQAPQQGLLGGGLHRPGFVANPGAGNGQTGGVQ